MGWVIDVHSPGLPAQVYRQGDLCLECRVYLAIEWVTWRGRRLMGKPRRDGSAAPMDEHCGGPSVFVNGRPWPRLQAWVISEGGRTQRELAGLKTDTNALRLALDPGNGAPARSDDALVEFVSHDGSRGIGEPAGPTRR